MVKIRLQRQGAKKAPFYHIVVADSKSPRDGRIIEKIGTYDPMTDPATVSLNKEKVEYWIKNGAKPTDTVKSLIEKTNKKEGIKMEEILKTIIINLVDNKEEVNVTRVDDEKGILLKVKVAKEDMGKVIGKDGKIAKAIRIIMKSVTSNEQKNVGVIFEEEE